MEAITKLDQAMKSKKDEIKRLKAECQHILKQYPHLASKVSIMLSVRSHPMQRMLRHHSGGPRSAPSGSGPEQQPVSTALVLQLSRAVHAVSCAVHAAWARLLTLIPGLIYALSWLHAPDRRSLTAAKAVLSQVWDWDTYSCALRQQASSAHMHLAPYHQCCLRVTVLLVCCMFALLAQPSSLLLSLLHSCLTKSSVCTLELSPFVLSRRIPG